MTKSDKPLTYKQTTYLASVPDSCKSLVMDSYTKRLQFSRKIKAKCLECSCYQRVEVTNCRAETCPLWSFRPYQATDIDSVMDTDLDTPADTDAPETREAMPLD